MTRIAPKPIGKMRQNRLWTNCLAALCSLLIVLAMALLSGCNKQTSDADNILEFCKRVYSGAERWDETCLPYYPIAIGKEQYSTTDNTSTNNFNLKDAATRISTPVQDDIAIALRKPFEFKGYKITPVAHFSVKARVLSARHYRQDGIKGLSPVDLALGWGKMSDHDILKHINISQSGRWYRYRYVGKPPIPKNEIKNSSANMHLVPGNQNARASMMKARKGHDVAFHGKLINIERRTSRSRQWWKSSLTRSDSGGGACEIVWVEEFFVQP